MEPGLVRRLLRRLEDAKPSKLRRFRVVFLPDLFVDHFVAAGSFPRFRRALEKAHDRGGGFVHGTRHRLRAGGNAANAAIALARLGVPTTLVAHTDRVGRSLMAAHAAGTPLDLSHVRDVGRASITAAIEFRNSARNLLISQAGPLEGFGPGDLTEGDWKAIARADLVGLFNWSLNPVAGTRLCEAVLRTARRAGARTFFDAADPTGQPPDLVLRLQRRVLSHGLVDAWGLNENELARFTGTTLAGKSKRRRRTALERLRARFHTRPDLHTRRSAVTWEGGEWVEVPALKVRSPVQTTGAGDAWNAGDVLGDLLGLAADERLLLANAFAAGYVGDAEGHAPTLGAVRSRLRASLRL